MSVPDFPLHFLRPWWWLALLPLPFALLALARGSSGRAALARLADAALLPHLIDDAGTRRRGVLAWAAAAWVLAVAALAGPAWQHVKTPLYVNGAARVVVLSLSDDMLAQDLKPDRITRARFAVRDLLDQAGDARTALVAYAGAAFTVAPLTDDRRTVLNLLRVLRPDVMPVPGNDAAAGIAQAVALLEQAHVQGGEIVLVTDTADAAAIRAARAAHARGIRVDVLGIGTAAGAPVPRSDGGFESEGGQLHLARRDDGALRDVAEAGGGRYAVLQPDGSGVAELGAPAAQAGHASRGERAEVWRDGGAWLLPILLALAALAFRRGWLLAFALLAAPVAMPVAHASVWESLWANRDQRALRALDRGDAERAKTLATTPGIRGAAEYRAGDFADAARAFAAGNDARSRYNLGNALAKLGDYREAIAAYDEALRLDPQMADARANREAVEQWLKRHSPPPRAADNRQGNRNGTGRNGAQSRSGQQSQGQQPGQSQPAPNGRSGAQSAQATPNPSAKDNGRQATPESQHDQGGASAGEDAAQRAQTGRAEQALRQELARRGRGAQHGGGSVNAAPPAFALGRGEAQDDDRFDAEQRAMLDAVPDDPGALLRRKFLLEWQRRQARQQENGQ